MASSHRIAASISAGFAVTLLCLVAAITSQAAHAQTFSVLYNFSGGGPAGKNPQAGLSMDGAGNLYGTTTRGGDPDCDFGFGCGTVFRLKRTTHGWVYDLLQVFNGPNGLVPMDRVVFGPDGALYGTAPEGGDHSVGVIFRLTPPPTFCHAISCPWSETVLYQFQGGSDGGSPYSEVLFDAAGNFYGTAFNGGGTGLGVVYKMTRSSGGWTYSAIYNFAGGQDGSGPYGGLTFDQAGNLYGTTYYGGGDPDVGTVYELTPSGNSWQETVLHRFNINDGLYSRAGLLFDQAGNLYGATQSNLFELSPANGGWNFSVIYSGSGSESTLAIDSARNLYGTQYQTNQNQGGEVFELSPQAGGWTYTTLHGFQGSDGRSPYSSVLIDAHGDLFGTTMGGGTHEGGVIWEITP